MIITGSITSGSPVVTGIADTAGLLAGMLVTGTGIPTNTRVASVDSSTQITLNLNATTTNAAASLEINTVFDAATTVVGVTTSDLSNATIYMSAQANVSASTSGDATVFNGGLSADVYVTAATTADVSVIVASLTGDVYVTGAASCTMILLNHLDADTEVSATMEGELSESSVNLPDSFAELTASAQGLITEAYWRLSGEQTISASASGTLQYLIDATANTIVSAIASGKIHNDAILRSEVQVAGNASAYISFVGEGLGVCDVINDILLLWGIEDARMSVEYLRERALNDLNAAMQLIWARAKDRDYFSRRTLTVSLGAGTSNALLDQEVQNILGPVRRVSDKRNLRPLSSKSQLDLFGHIFLGQTSAAVGTGVPQAFFAERLNQNRPDNTKIVLHVVPPPEDATDLLVDVAMECPRYEWRDYCQCTPLHIPHRYAESVLFPVCRHRAMSSQYFIKEDRRELIENEYSTAMQMLGLVDPQLKEADASKGVA